MSQPRYIANGVLEHYETLLTDLHAVNGYLASAFLTFDGIVIAEHATDPTIHVQIVSAIINDILASAHEASAGIGLQACTEVVIHAAGGMVIVECSGVDAPVHLHCISVMKSDGNRTLMELEIKKALARIVAELS